MVTTVLSQNARQLEDRGELPEWSTIWYSRCLCSMSGAWFRENMRLTLTQFEELLMRMGARLRINDAADGVQATHRGRQMMRSPHQQLACFLWYAATGQSRREAANLFGIPTTSVHRTVIRVAATIVEELYEEFVRPPTGAAVQENAARFEKMRGLPRVFACVDGTHFLVRAAMFHKKYCVGRKG